jgi:large subunit ribosomal protein L23
MSIAAHQERLMTVIRGPHLSEKAHMAAESNQVVLKVRTDATKAEIRQAVELLFDVKVDDVQVINVKGKSKRFGQTRGRRSDWKKAYVRLAEGSSLEAFLGVE